MCNSSFCLKRWVMSSNYEQINDEKNNWFFSVGVISENTIFAITHEQENIPVGCIPPARQCTGGTLFGGFPWQRTPPGRDLPLDRDHRQKAHGTRDRDPPRRNMGSVRQEVTPYTLVDRQTPVKTLPCPRLRLRSVTKTFRGHWINRNKTNLLGDTLDTCLPVHQTLRPCNHHFRHTTPSQEYSGSYCHSASSLPDTPAQLQTVK